MGEIVRAIILGFVQGTTEFLPISSSGHLMLFPWVFGWDPHPLAFDVALHLGTLIAILAYYHRDFLRLAIAFLRGIRERSFREYPDRVMALLVIVGTIPAGIAGFVFESSVEGLNDRPVVVAIFLIVTGVLLLLAQLGRGMRTADSLTTRDALVIGVAQAFAIIPGVSRAGSTIVMGIFRGLRPEESARFSFYLSVPIILGAGASQILSFGGDEASMSAAALIAGVVTAAITAFFSIGILLRLMASRRIGGFAYYCFGLGAFILAFAWYR